MNETKLCKKCGKEVPINRIKEYIYHGELRLSNICKDCYNAHVRQKQREANIRKFMEDESMKIQIYKEIHPTHILDMGRSGIEPIAEDEVILNNT